MSIKNVVISTSDLQRSIDFYTVLLEAKLVTAPTVDHAVLDLVTATLELRRTENGASEWVPDDLQLGFRHIGFKVDQLNSRVDALKSAGVSFHLDPVDAEGGVRICFFYDPDGTLLELVEGNLRYATVLDADLVASERALGLPLRPRFDHVALTVKDRAATVDFYHPLGFSFMGTIEQPNDTRGFSIGYLKSGDTVLETFTFEASKTPQPAIQLKAPGFAYVEFDCAAPAPPPPVTTDGNRLVVNDPNGFLFAAEWAGPVA